MWSAGRRLPARVAQQPQLLTGRMLGQQTLALQRHVAPLASRHQQLQVRAFFGLKDWLISGKKKDATATTDEAATQAATADASTTTAVAGEAPPGVEQPEASAEPLVGSLDPIQYSVGKYARLADGAIMSTQGKTMVLSTTVSPASTSGAKKKDFLPLMVDYRIKFHAVGLIPDTQRRSEMTNTDEEILESRIIDRVIRPLFPRDYVDETQVIATVHSLDPANDPLVLAVNSTSAALAVSDIPWNGPVGCVRVVEINGQLVANPTKAQRDAATLDIVYAANATRVLMIEADGHEIPEERMAEALRFAHEKVQPLLAEQKKLVEQHGKPKREYVRTVVPEDVAAKAREIGVGQLFSGPRAAKMDRRQAEHETYEALLAGLREAFAGREDVNDDLFQIAAHDVVQTALRERILAGDRNSRLDGRSHSMIRPLQIETDVLPMAHGSSVFGRGDTQALCSVTLGPLDRGLRLRTAHQNPKNEAEFKHAILHYEFPPYCVNETGRMGGVNRRMVGHGALAEKAIVPVLPSTETFPFTVRMTSETMGSDGSSSMATVCGVCMALMDAGVPIKTPVAGISIGLVTEGDPFDGTKPIGSYRLLTDILGTEDHYGDMDFKIAGTDTGITAIQLDVKLPGVPLRILCQGLQHAKKARSFVLKRMAAELAAPREQLKSTTSAVTGTTEGTSGVHGVIKFSVPANSIGSLIGTGGSTIREIENATGCSISIVDRNKGEIRVTGPAEALESAQAIVQEQTGSAAHSFYKVGGKYEMRVVEVMDFGAILEATAPTKNRGFVHITELADTRVTNIHDVIKVGQVLEFACLQEGVSGKMSIKALRAGEGAAADGPEGTTTPKRPVSGVPKRRAKSIHTTARPHRTTKATVDNKSQE